jgi:hypothetical protein
MCLSKPSLNGHSFECGIDVGGNLKTGAIAGGRDGKGTVGEAYPIFDMGDS